MKTRHLVFPVLALSHGIDDTTLLSVSNNDDTTLLSVSDDTPTLLSLKMKVHQRLETGLDHLLDVAGNRNVTQLSALLQNLVQDTIESSGYDLDGEVQAALQMIKEALLGDIRGALKDAHCHDQQELHEQITCFEKCEERKADGALSCGESCDGTAHKVCRDSLLKKYKKHINDCRALDDFVHGFTKQNCPKFEKKCCLLSHTTWNCGLCETKIAGVDVDGSTGQWINKQIGIFERAHVEWTALHKTCTQAYHDYIAKDAECDCAQAECETKNCEWESCHYLNCEDNYNKCWGRCEAEYTRTNEAKECLEKDRKIDWSATEKIECYVDVLLKKPSNKTLLEECGTEDCINKFREQEYHKCNERCVEVDFDSGEKTFHDRREDDIDVTNEGVESVFTKHRGGGEDRCTSHLDLDYQLPPCCNPCEARPSPPCEGRGDYKDESSYMWIHYDQFGHFSEDGVENTASQAICHAGEHSKVYAYNLCDCTECPTKQQVDPPTCTQAKACRAGSAYDYTQHDITNACQTTPAPPMDLPESNCPIPAESKACHFWGDPHFSHLFFSHLKMADSKKGGRHHGHHVVEFRPFGVFNLAENEDQTFQAQAFFCPWRNSGAPGVGAGLAMRFGDDIIQVVRGQTAHLHKGSFDKDTTQFFVNGKLKAWDELGNATGSQIRGTNVPGTGGLTTAFMYMQQEKTTNQNPYLPVCVGNAQDTLVEVGVQSMYYQDVTIRTNQPGNRGIASGICSVPDGNIHRTDANEHEKYRVEGSKVLFSTMQMKHLCDVCNLDAHEDRSGWTCGAPGMNASPEQVCKSTGADLNQAKTKCGEVFDADDDWFGVCVMETCASGKKAVAISRIEEHLQHLMVEEE